MDVEILFNHKSRGFGNAGHKEAQRLFVPFCHLINEPINNFKLRHRVYIGYGQSMYRVYIGYV